jgi:putative phosphoesterase
MLVVLSDTHGRDDARLTGRTREAVHGADAVVHAGDFLTERVLDAFHDAAARLHAVYGNNDPPAVRDRVPARRVFDYGGVRFAVVHGHEHTDQALSFMAREVGADCVVVGHSHRPGIRRAGAVPVLNPGSHADPRRYEPAHAELVANDGNGEEPLLAGRLLRPDGTLLEEFEIGGRASAGTGEG